MRALDNLYRNLSILSHVLHRIIVPESLRNAGYGALSKQQYELLRYIQDHPAVHPGKLAKAFDISAPTVSAMLQRLEQKELIEKTPNPNDQRAVNIRITTSGSVLLEAVEDERRELIARLVEPLNQQEMDTLDKGVTTLLHAIAQTQDRNMICLHCGNANSAHCLLAQGLTCAQVAESH
jgi:DNA-binding MarR family transcriptional regulator